MPDEPCVLTENGARDHDVQLWVDSAAANSFHEDGLAPMHRACFGDVQADTLRVFLEAGMDRDLLTRCARKHILSTFSSKIPRRCLTTWLLAAMTKLAVVAKPV